jgi:hypothetical protein
MVETLCSAVRNASHAQRSAVAMGAAPARGEVDSTGGPDMPTKEVLATHEGHEIRVVNTWFSGAAYRKDQSRNR